MVTSRLKIAVVSIILGMFMISLIFLFRHIIAVESSYNPSDYQSEEHRAVVTKVNAEAILPSVTIRNGENTSHIAPNINLNGIIPGDTAVYVKSKDNKTFAIKRIIPVEEYK